MNRRKRGSMRTIQQIVSEITKHAPSARVLGGERSYASVEIPGSGGAHADIYLAPAGEGSVAVMRHDPSDKGSKITFLRGSKREEKMIAAVSNFLILHEAVRDRKNEGEV